MNQSHRLSKSKFLSGSQCHLRLWNDFHAAKLAVATSDSQLAVFKSGHEVGELACERYLGGHLIEHDHLHFDEALTETNMVLGGSNVPALFESAIEHEGLIARVDILERLPAGGWRVIEVKSTTRVKPVHDLDLAFQLYIARKSGIDVREAGILTLNREYVYDGKKLDLNELFRFHDGLEQAVESIDITAEQAREMQELIKSEEAPDVEIGDHCFHPYDCPYYTHCSYGVEFPEYPIGELPNLSRKRREELDAENIIKVHEIPEDFPLSERQQIIRRAILEERVIVNHEVLGAVDSIERPIRHLDFETFAPAIPRFKGTSPFDAIPFLFSVHTEREGQTPSHTDYLHESKDDPRLKIADALIEAVGDSGTICTYGAYEQRILADLIKAIPKREKKLRAISDRLFDMLKVIRSAYYHPDLHGSFSLKSVFPVLCPDSGYDDLDIADGQFAAVQYMNAIDSEDSKRRKQIFSQLREYCERDTLATFKVRQALSRIAQSDVSE